MIIPPRYWTQLLEEVHEGHLGYMWWPGMDKMAGWQEVVKWCTGWQLTQNNLKTVPRNAWKWPALPWQHIHVDFGGPFLGTMFLIIVDAHSKWPKVILMTSTSSSRTSKELFATHGLPEQLVNEKSPSLQQTRSFMRSNGITEIRSAPYHPATNGIAEQFVQTFKKALRAVLTEKKTIFRKLTKFLLACRTIPHVLTVEAPVVLLMRRDLRTRLDILKPNIWERVEEKQQDQELQSSCELDIG